MLARVIHFVVLVLAIGIPNIRPTFAESRTWTDKSGTRKVQAELVNFDGKTAQLRRDSDKKVVSIPLEQLSELDQTYLQATLTPKSNTPETPATAKKTGVAAIKAATALADLHTLGSGSAFCIRADGIFITNRHVIQAIGMGGKLDLVLNPGEIDEQVHRATVVSISQEFDLAILKVDVTKGQVPQFPTLPIGDSSALSETDQVAAIGYPFGRMLAQSESGYPACSVHTGRVTALRRNGGELAAIQTDARVNPGNSGGPLIDSKGNVIGIVVSMIGSSGLGFAIPTSDLNRFLQQPALYVPRTDMLFRDRYKPLHLDIQVFQYQKAANQNLSVEVAMVSNNQRESFRTSERDGIYVLEEPIFQRPEAPEKYVAVAWYDGVPHQGVIDDRQIQIGSREMTLSEAHWISKRPDASILFTTYGDKVAGQITGLGSLQSKDGTEHSLDDADYIELFASEGFPGHRTSAVVKQGNTIVATALVPLYVNGVPYTYDAEVGDELSSEIIVEAFIDGVSELHIGQDGMYWVHRSGTSPGREENGKRYVKVNGEKWFIEWENGGNGISRLLKSKKYKMSLTSAGMNVAKLWVRKGHINNPNLNRGQIQKVVQGNETVVYVIDQPNGAAEYRLRLTRRGLASYRHYQSEYRDLIARWTFDSGHEGLNTDQTGRGNFFGLKQNATFTDDGKSGKALSFDGVGAHAQIMKSGDINLGGVAKRTVSLWFQHQAGGEVNQVIWTQGSRSRGLNIYLEGKRLYVGAFDTREKNKWSKYILCPTTIETGKWHHVALVLDGQKGVKNGFRGYLDGKLFGEGQGGLVQSHAEAYIGGIGLRTTVHDKEVQQPGRWFKGSVDEIRVFNRALTGSEVSELASEFD